MGAEGWLPVRWLTCDEGCGRSGDFRDAVAALDPGYRAEVPVDTRLWPARPPTVMPRTRPRLVPGAPASLEVRALAAQLSTDVWTRQRVPGDSRGPEYAHCAIRRVVASRCRLLVPEVGLVLRRQPGADPIRVFLCHALRLIQPARLTYLTGARWAIETCFREGTQLLSLVDYEGRSWQGWHRHTTLRLHFFLLQGKLARKKSHPF